MKLIITLKDPRGIEDGVYEAVGKSLEGFELTDRENERLTDRLSEALYEKLKLWSPDGDRVSIEFDTDAGTARVLTAAEVR